jgi:predicted DNA-binding protein YlxM (UPF0122 family)
MAGNKRWAFEDVDFLVKNYGLLSVSEIANEIKRSEDAVHWKASSLGIKFEKKIEIASMFQSLNEKLTLINEKLISIEEKLPNKI